MITSTPSISRFVMRPLTMAAPNDTQERTMTKSTYPSRFATFPRSFVMGFLDANGANKAAPVRLNQPFRRDNSFFNGRTFSLGIRGGF